MHNDFGIIVEPRAILTDTEQAPINAIDEAYKNTQAVHMLCVWYIVMNITAHHKKDFDVTDEPSEK